MAIGVICPNGHRMNVSDQLAGKRGKCSKCGVAVEVPQAAPLPVDDDPGYEVVADEPSHDVHEEVAAPRAIHVHVFGVRMYRRVCRDYLYPQ